MNRSFLIAGSALLLLSGCVTTERDLRIDTDLNTLKEKLSRLEQEQAEQMRTREAGLTETASLIRRQADLQAGQDALRVEMQALRGLIDDSAARRREQQDAASLAEKDVALRLGAIDARLGKAEKDLAELRKLAQNPPPPAVAPEALYDQGRDLIQKKEDPAKGRKILEEFVKARPQSELVPNALYWMGEADYSNKNFENAILQFQDVIEKYPSHPKAAAALFKQALAFEAMNEPKKAQALLRKLVDSYPQSDEAQRARERLAGKN